MRPLEQCSAQQNARVGTDRSSRRIPTARHRAGGALAPLKTFSASSGHCDDHAMRFRRLLSSGVACLDTNACDSILGGEEEKMHQGPKKSWSNSRCVRALQAKVSASCNRGLLVDGHPWRSRSSSRMKAFYLRFWGVPHFQGPSQQKGLPKRPNVSGYLHDQNGNRPQPRAMWSARTVWRFLRQAARMSVFFGYKFTRWVITRFGAGGRCAVLDGIENEVGRWLLRSQIL